MSVCFEHGFPNLSEQFSKRRTFVKLSAQYQGIGEKAYKTLDLFSRAIRDRRSDADVVLSAVTVKQRLECRQENHEHGR